MRNSLLALAVLVFSAGSLGAQTDGTYGGFSPYSVFGLGQMHQSGTSWNRGMGGVGIAARNHRFINILNPASMTARDSLSFMADMGLGGRISVFSEEDKRALNTTFNIEDVAISFPMWRHTAFMVGVTPVSDVGYNISYRDIDVYTQQRQFSSYGNGGTYQLFAAAAATFWNRLSIGAQFNYTFGNISKKSSIVFGDESYRTIAHGDSLQVNNVSGKFGIQYEQPVSGQSVITVGATYKLSTPIFGHSISFDERGSYERKRTSSELNDKGLRMGDELGVGISFRRGDDFLVEFDYTRSDWSKSRMDQVSGFSNVGDVVFAPSVGQSFRLGGEFTPNRNDVRTGILHFFRRCTFRGGVYYDQSHYIVDGAHVNTVGVTLGTTLPVFRWYNGLSIGLEFGSRGLSSSQVRERYFGFSVGFNIFDIWFQKHAYQ